MTSQPPVVPHPTTGEILDDTAARELGRELAAIQASIKEHLEEADRDRRAEDGHVKAPQGTIRSADGEARDIDDELVGRAIVRCPGCGEQRWYGHGACMSCGVYIHHIRADAGDDTEEAIA